ncbi:TonB-dependent siderophore receptor [Aquabacterium lacunae]|uniref:TonB-dependent siderophore receptor n=1 Tax=Aquabacterium lacunae TaxID=2528630 RepID=A0A4Q9GW92_9BURK|nr:TonB-dependent receptor [Aquabacterium lacunae]TBO28690.1 TonB-dependent siderophore receptor [Aquabacterium lacunae]
MTCAPVLRPFVQLLALALGHMALLANAQTSSALVSTAALDSQVVAPRARVAQASISGLGDTPAWKAPVQAERFDGQSLKQAQVTSLADLTTMVASMSDAYNAGGYWGIVSLRGFELDNTQNYLREGLPINAETVLPLGNKAGVEVFKGTSGLQAGVSAPGGLVNLLVKRPTGHVRSVELGLSSRRGLNAGFDLADRFGEQERFGLRVHGQFSALRPNVHPQDGQAHAVGVAADWRVGPGTLLEVELEHNRSRQNSVPGYSVFGANGVVDASLVDPDVSLNGHGFSQPMVSEGSTGSIRLTQQLGSGWQWQGSYGEQHLRTDDRAAFPLGCSGGSAYVPDRFCDDGRHDIYNYISENETRLTRAYDTHVKGQWAAWGTHELQAGLAGTHQSSRQPTAVYDLMGLADAQGQLVASDFKAFPTPQNNRDMRSTSVYVRDSWQLSERWTTWLGARSTRYERSQWLSDGASAVSTYADSLVTPWAAIGYQVAAQQQVYVSWGEGAENLLSPFFSTLHSNYTNPGSYLPVAKSRQLEVGYKGQWQQTYASVNLFGIKRPMGDFVTDGAGATTYQLDGIARHEGIEAEVRHRVGAVQLNGSAVLMKARREGSVQAGISGLQPVNVPDHSVRAQVQYHLPTLPRASVALTWVHEGRRAVDSANTLHIPSWNRFDLGAQFIQTAGEQTITWNLGIKNLLDTRAWRESPYKFAHLYLIPMASRTAAVTAQIDF